MYLSTFQVLYKLYLSTDVLKYKVLLPGSARHTRGCRVNTMRMAERASGASATDLEGGW